MDHDKRRNSYEDSKPLHKFDVIVFIKATLQIRANSEDAVKILVDGLTEDRLAEGDFTLPIAYQGHNRLIRVEIGEITQTG